MPAWLEVLLKTGVPILLTALAGLLASVLLTTRRLRAELVADAQIMPTLNRAAQVALRAEMDRRTMLMVATSRYPVLVLSDVLRILTVLLLVGFEFFTIWDLIHNEPPYVPETIVVPLIATGLSVTALRDLNVGFNARQEARDKVAYARHEHPTESDRLVTQNARSLVLFVAVMVTAVTPGVVWFAMLDLYGGPDFLKALVILGPVGFGMFLLGRRWMR